MIKLVKPDLMYYSQYNEMMTEWTEGIISPWFLDKPCKDIHEFYKLIRKLDDIEKGIVDSIYSASTSYFAMDDNKLIGAARLAHYLTVEGLEAWGHIGYGVRPSERKKGYATEILSLVLDEGAAKYNIRDFLIGAYEDNIGSIKVIEKNGGIYEKTVFEQSSGKSIKQYWIHR